MKRNIYAVALAGFAMVGWASSTLSAQPSRTPNQNPDWTLPVGPDTDTGPCEELGNPTLGKDKRITIEMNQRERELAHLSVLGWVVDMEHELDGVGGWAGSVYPVLFGGTGEAGSGLANPPFEARSFFLNYFIEVVGPSIQERVYGQDLISDFNLQEFGGPVATDEELEDSVQAITLTGCERLGLDIAIEKWNDGPDGQVGRHIHLCERSKEMEETSACASFFPLAEAYQSLSAKLEEDQ